MDWTTWIVLPAAGALIGYVTNRVAIVMLFRPHAPRRVLGLPLRGLVPKRQPELARKIGEVVGTHLVGHDDLVAAFRRVATGPILEELIGRAIDKKLADLAALPVVGAFLTPDRVAGIRDGITAAVLEQEDVVAGHLEQAIEEHVDIAALVEDKVAGFPTERMEEIVLDVARHELRAIEAWGAVLGSLIGLAQAALVIVMR